MAQNSQNTIHSDHLTAEEQEAWLAEFSQVMTTPSEEEKIFFAGRRQSGQGVGLTDGGELVYQTPDKQ